MFISINRVEAKNTARTRPHVFDCVLLQQWKMCSNGAHPSTATAAATTSRNLFYSAAISIYVATSYFCARTQFHLIWFCLIFAYSLLSDWFFIASANICATIYKLIIIRKMCCLRLRNAIKCIWLTRAIFVSVMFYENYKTKLFAIWLPFSAAFCPNRQSDHMLNKYNWAFQHGNLCVANGNDGIPHRNGNTKGIANNEEQESNKKGQHQFDAFHKKNHLA